MASATQYEGYGGNPYGNAEAGYGGFEAQQPLDQGQVESHEMSVISSAPQAEQPTAYVQPVSQRDFLDQVAVVRDLLKDFDGSLSEVRSLHQRLLDAVDAPSSSELGIRLQQIEAQTFARNEQIRKLIKTLAQDAANTRDNLRDMKLKQVAPLKTDFQSKLTAYQGLEQDYRTRRQEQIRRQYLVVNPDATDSELAAVADASNDPRAQNVFQMALENRRGQAQTALSAVRARHDELQRIEQTIIELAAMFNDMDQLVVSQEPAVERTEESAEQAQEDVGKGNVEVAKAIKHARNRNKLKWYCLLICVLIVLAIALGVGLGVGLSKAGTSSTTKSGP